MIPNLSYIQKLADGSLAFEKKMIGIIQKEFPEEKQAFLIYFKTKDYKNAAELVHKIKHKIGMLSMSESYNFAIDFESELKINKTEGFSNFLTILETIENYINSL